MTQKNAAVVERALKAFLDGDQEAFLAELDDDVIAHVAGSNRLTGDYKGKSEFLSGFMATVMEVTGGNIMIEKHDIFGGSDHVCGTYTFTAKKGSETVSWRHMNLYHIQNGKIAEFWWNPFDQAEVDAFFS